MFTSGPLDGEVLIAGGQGESGGIVGTLDSAELYDPGTGTFSTTGTMAVGRYGHTATLFSSGTLAGEVLLTGGSQVIAQSSAETYNPSTGTFTSTASNPTLCPDSFTSSPPTGCMTVPRVFHTATLLTTGPNAGKVLITGGQNDSSINDSAELYDPATNTFSPTATTMNSAREHHTATLITSGSFAGDVLIAGGDDGTAALSSTEIYDASGGTFVSEASMSVGRTLLAASDLLSGTEAMLAGGANSPAASRTVLSSGDLSTVSAVSATGALVAARESATATLFTSGTRMGTVLIAGGDDATNSLSSAELFDSSSGGSFAATGPMNSARTFHTATLLLTGKVLIVGGATTPNVPTTGTILNSAELYQP